MTENKSTGAATLRHQFKNYARNYPGGVWTMVNELDLHTAFENSIGGDIWRLVDCVPDSVPDGQDEYGISYDLQWAEGKIDGWIAELKADDLAAYDKEMERP